MGRLLPVTLIAVAAQCLGLLGNLANAEFDTLQVTSTRCSTDGECTENAECSRPQGFCFCQQGFVFFEDVCLPAAAKIGDACSVEIQCQLAFGADATCKFGADDDAETGTCQCKADSHFAARKCHKTSLVGDRCASRSDCSTKSGPENVYCVSSVCVCHQDFHPNIARDQCMPNIALGADCVWDEECVAEHALCYGKCSCQTGAVPAPDRHRCLLVAHDLDDVCEVDAQCLQFLPLTACRGGQCSCAAGNHRIAEKCWRSKNLNDVCEDWRECGHSGSMVCSADWRCRCAQGFRPHDEFGCRPNSSAHAEALPHLISGLILFILANYS